MRIGNGAADQLQLDIFGEVMDSVHLYDKDGAPISYELWTALCRQLDWLETHWEEPDCGVWEVRGPRQRFTYSTLMTWVAFERAGRLARRRGLPAPLPPGASAADRAYLQLQERGWNPRDRRLRAVPAAPRRWTPAPWCMPLVGFTGAEDPRFLSTLDRIEAELVTDSLVHRYRTDGSDGFDEPEGTFNLCSFWYVEALTRAGRLDQARHTFEKMLTYANHLGLYAEEIGPSGEALGNFPQAFTHLGLIRAAVKLDRALASWRGDMSAPPARSRVPPARAGRGSQVHPGAGRGRPARRHPARRPGAAGVAGTSGSGAARAAAAPPPGPHRFRPDRRAAGAARPAPAGEVPGFALLLRAGASLRVLVHGPVRILVDGRSPRRPESLPGTRRAPRRAVLEDGAWHGVTIAADGTVPERRTRGRRRPSWRSTWRAGAVPGRRGLTCRAPRGVDAPETAPARGPAEAGDPSARGRPSAFRTVLLGECAVRSAPAHVAGAPSAARRCRSPARGGRPRHRGAGDVEARRGRALPRRALHRSRRGRPA